MTEASAAMACTRAMLSQVRQDCRGQRALLSDRVLHIPVPGSLPPEPSPA
jgi:hypothetical protein